MGGFFDGGGGSSIFRVRRTKYLHLPPSRPEERITFHLPSYCLEGRKTFPFFVLPIMPPRSMTTSSFQLCEELDFQTDLPPWRSVRRSRSALYSDCNLSNPAGRVGRRTAGRLGGAGPAGWDADGFVRAGHNRPSCPPGHRRQLS